MFADSLLVLDEKPTARQQSYFGMIAAHEIAHQWFGDLVTPSWWDDTWLNESFAEWLGVKIADEWRPALGIQQEQLSRTLEAMNTDALKAGRAIHQPVERNAQIDSTFDDITYEKGAGVLRMIESYLGEERFRAGVRLHLRKHLNSTATAADFFEAMSEAARDPKVLGAFRSFVDQAGVPIVAVRKSQNRGVWHLSQTRYRPLGIREVADTLWSIPLCLRDAAAPGAVKKSCTLMTTREASVSLPGAGEAGAVMPNVDGAGYYRFSLDGAVLDSLLQRSAQLPAREAATLADSVAAAFDAGALDFATLLRAAMALASHSDRNAGLLLGTKLVDIHDRLLQTEQWPALERKLVGIYGPRLREIGFEPQAGRYAGESAEQELLRRALITLVAEQGRDDAVRRELAAAAVSSLADPRALDASIRSRAWTIAVQDEPDKMAGPLEDIVLHSTDPQRRNDAVRALSQAETPEVSARVLELVLNPRLEVPSAFGLLYGQLYNPHSQRQAWDWLESHRDAVIERGKGILQSQMAQLAGNVCDAAGRERFNAVLAERLRPLSGGEISVGRTLERIDVCMAVKAAQSAGVRDALSH